MFRKVFMSMVIVLIFLAGQVQADDIYSTWVGGYGYWWLTAENWEPAIIPNNDSDSFYVIIDGAGAGERVYLDFTFIPTISSLKTYGQVSLKGKPGQLQILFGLTNHGSLNIQDLEIKTDVNNTNGAVLALDDTQIEGSLYNYAGAIIDIDYEVDVEGGGLGNAGLIEIAATGEIYVNPHFNNVGEILINGGECGVDDGIFDNNSTGLIKGFGLLFAEQSLQNKGAIYAYGGSLAVISKGPLSNSGRLSNYPLSSLQIRPAEDVNNYGTIDVHAGGGVAFDCNLVNVADANIHLRGGTFAAKTITQSADANFAGFGGITGDIVIDPNGIIKLTGPTNIVGNVEVGDNATLEISDGTTLITGHTTCNNGTIRMIGGRVICQGGLTNNDCNIIWEPGAYTNMADFNLDGKVDFKDFAYFGDTWLWQADWY